MQDIYEVTFKITKNNLFDSTDLGYETVEVAVPKNIRFPKIVAESEAENKLRSKEYSYKQYSQPERIIMRVVSIKKIK